MFSSEQILGCQGFSNMDPSANPIERITIKQLFDAIEEHGPIKILEPCGMYRKRPDLDHTKLEYLGQHYIDKHGMIYLYSREYEFSIRDFHTLDIGKDLKIDSPIYNVQIYKNNDFDTDFPLKTTSSLEAKDSNIRCCAYSDLSGNFIDDNGKTPLQDFYNIYGKHRVEICKNFDLQLHMFPSSFDTLEVITMGSGGNKLVVKTYDFYLYGGMFTSQWV